MDPNTVGLDANLGQEYAGKREGDGLSDKPNKRTLFMPAALILTKASPAAREGLGTCSRLSTDSMTPFCANRRAFMVVLSIEAWKRERELTPWFYIVQFARSLTLRRNAAFPFQRDHVPQPRFVRPAFLVFMGVLLTDSSVEIARQQRQNR